MNSPLKMLATLALVSAFVAGHAQTTPPAPSSKTGSTVHKRTIRKNPAPPKPSVESQIQALRQDGEELATEQASLELAEAKLLSPARMEELARDQQFIDPPAQRVVYLENAQAGTVAMNKK